MKNYNLPSVMSHSFSEVPRVNMPRSSFDRSHGYKTTFDHGLLVPFLVDEVIPGDTFNVDVTAIARLATPLRPFMDNIKIDTHFFFVPLRLLQTNFVKMMGEQTNPGDTIAYAAPTMTSTAVTGYLAGSVMDYMGLPTEIPGLVHNTYALRAYNKIYNDWYRDENLQNSVVVDTDDGPDTVTDYSTVLPRGKRHDYFTSCLPWPQKGDAVSIPIALAGSANVYGQELTNTPYNFAQFLGKQHLWQGVQGASGPGAITLTTGSVSGTAAEPSVLQADGIAAGGAGATAYPQTWDGAAAGETNGLTLATAAQYTTKNAGFGSGWTISGGVFQPPFADLSTAGNVSFTINDLRLAFATQKLLEQSARGGTRYTEILRSMFGVTSSDARLQRAEYLGGGSSDVVTSEIPQTSQTSGSNVLGQLAAKGTALLRGHGFTRSFEEHGVVLGIVSTRADLTYQEGLNRMWSRSTRYDWYFPVFAHLGEQAVLNKEIYAQGSANPTQDAATFGYQERWAEYRYKPSNVTGQFRSNHATPLDSWHLAIDFTALPALNSTFIVETQVPVDRVTAVPSDPNYLFDSYIRMKCVRVMPTYSVPGQMDRF